MSLFVNKTLFDNYASYYHENLGLSEWRRVGAIDKCRNILSLCGHSEHESVLEIGCGDGAILERLSALGFGKRLIGLEISASAINAAQTRNIPRVEVKPFDGYEVPFEKRQFDLAILSHVIEHVEHPRQLIYEAARVARKVFIEVPLEDNWKLASDFVLDKVGHINFYNLKTIRQLVQSCGMRIADARLSHGSVHSYVFRKGKISGVVSYTVKRLILRLGSPMTSLFTYNYGLICEKAVIDRPKAQC